MVDASGIKGWAPASYLVPVDDSTLQEETQENKELIGNERGNAVANMVYFVHACTLSTCVLDQMCLLMHVVVNLSCINLHS